jgi:hypothetical protein
MPAPAAMAVRPCVTSDSRRRLISFTLCRCNARHDHDESRACVCVLAQRARLSVCEAERIPKADGGH